MGCIRKFKTSVVYMLLGFPHIQEALEYLIKSEELNSSSSIIDIKIFSANAMMLAVLERVCENDDFTIKKIWKEGNTWVNHLLKVLVFNYLNDTRIRFGENMSNFVRQPNLNLAKQDWRELEYL